MQLLALGFDAAFVGQFATQALQFNPAVVFQMEGACDLAGADLAGLVADEGEDFFLAGEGDWLGMMLGQMSSLRLRRCLLLKFRDWRADSPARRRVSWLQTLRVIAGLDPAIQLSANKMDARVKPAHDAGDRAA